MLSTLLTTVVALAAAGLVSIVAAVTASADGGACGLPSGRPPCTILRPTAPSRSERLTSAVGSECIVVVGGLGSPTDGSDAGFFAQVLGALTQDPRFRVIRFGVDAGAYDTYGAISRSGEGLRAVISGASGECRATHVVAHSMGGAVVDRAFSKGDVAAAGVVTYIALASPHNGAMLARAIRPAVDADAIFASGLGAVARATRLGHDPTSAAVRDLARMVPPRPARDVEAVRLRMVSDEFVLHRDNADRRVEVREYMPASALETEGHGGIVHNVEVRDVVRSTILTHHVPDETRAPGELERAAFIAKAVDAALASVEGRVGIGLLTAARATHSELGPLEGLLAAAATAK